MDLHGDSPILRQGSSAPSSVGAWREDLWRDLPADSLQTLSAVQQAELASLRKEQNPEILAASLLRLAGRLEREGRQDLALQLYRKIAECPERSAPPCQLAKDRALALQGQGAVGARAEALLSHLFEEAMSPAPIVAMGVAGGTFKLGRALSLKILRNAPFGAGLARAGANAFGLLTESAAFTMSAKSVSQALGHRQDWSLTTLRKEWFSGTVLLGSLKAAGALGHQSGRGLARLASRTEIQALNQGLVLAARAATPLSLYAGILFAHDVESALGLREAPDGATKMVDGLATLLHLQVGGSLARRLGANRLNRAATELEWRLGNLPRKPSGFPEIFSPQPAIAFAGRPGDRPPARDPFPNKPLQMSVLASSQAPRFGLEELQRIHDYTRKMDGTTNDLLRFFLRNTRGLEEMRVQHEFLLLLSRTWVGKQTAVLNNAIHTLYAATRYAKLDSNASSYANWLIKLSFEESFRRFEPDAMDCLLSFLGRGGKVLDLERGLQPLFPEGDIFRGPLPPPAFWRGRESLYGRIRNLPLSSAGRGMVGRWTHATLSSPRPAFAGHANPPLLDLLEYHLGIPGRAEQVERVLSLATRSPLALARLARLQIVLKDGLDVLTSLKLEELADPESTIYGLEHAWPVPKSYVTSQASAYMDNGFPTALLSQMKTHWNNLLDPTLAQERQEQRIHALEKLFPDGAQSAHLSKEVLAQAFRELGDPFSREIAEALLQEKVLLEILPERAFKHRAHELNDGNIEVTEGAFYYVPQGSRTKGLILIRSPELKAYSPESSRNAFFELMGTVVHEYRHYLDLDPRERRTPPVHLSQEMSGHYAEYLWRALHGDTIRFHHYTRDASLGPAMQFLDYYEAHYGHWWPKTRRPDHPQRAARQGP